MKRYYSFKLGLSHRAILDNNIDDCVLTIFDNNNLFLLHDTS